MRSPRTVLVAAGRERRHRVGTGAVVMAFSLGALAPAAASAAPGGDHPGDRSGYPTGTKELTFGPSTITWGACSHPSLKARGAECGYVDVPLDHDRPDGEKIKIAVSRIKHTSSDDAYQGALLLNPGGPGGSGLTLPLLSRVLPKEVSGAYDWIGFDPRGVGSSKPALSCDPDYSAGPRPIYEPFRRTVEKAWLAKVKGYAADCAKAAPELLPHLTTVDAAKDVDLIRKALGQKKINFLGFSYGTYLAQVYATLFPRHVRKFVLDGVVDPTRVFYQSNIDQNYGFEKNIKIWFAWVAKYDSVYHLGTTGKQVERRWYAERARLAKNPAGGTIGASEWTDIFNGAAYYQFSWLELADMWATWDATHKDPKPLIDQYAGDGDNGYAMYLAVECTDARWPQNWNFWRKDNWRVYREAPYLTWSNAWYNAPCAFWPVKGGPRVDVGSHKVPPILFVSETSDAATPFSGAVQARTLFPNSRLLALPGGTTHSGSMNGNACEDGLIAKFLLDGTLPPRDRHRAWDATCAPLPQPDPTAKPASSAGSSSGAARGTLR